MSMSSSAISQKKKIWRQLENAAANAVFPAAEIINALRFDPQGLLPVIAQCADSNRVLMLAWMNREALTQTLASGMMTYYSRSRQCLWKKGETSGCYQRLCELQVDCDGDSLLATVKQSGGACHTGKPTCFYLTLNAEQATVRE